MEDVFDNDDDNVTMVNKDIDVLLKLWQTEVNAPEILIFDEELIGRIQGSLSQEQVIIPIIDVMFTPFDCFSTNPGTCGRAYCSMQ